MEKIKDIKDLEAQLDKLKEELNKTRLLDDDEIEEYKNLSDEQKREKYTEQECEAADKYIKLSDEENEKREQIEAKAIEAFDTVSDEIKALEDEVDKNDKEIQMLEAEIKDIKSQIELKEQALKDLEAKGDYDQAEYDSLTKEIEALKLKLDEKTKLYGERTEVNNKAKEKLEKLNKEKQQLLEDYGDIIEPHLEIKLANIQEKWDAKREQVQVKMKRLAAIKESKEYKDGDENALKEAKDLDREIAYGVLEKDELSSQLTEMRKTLNEIEGREVSDVKHESLSKRIKDAQARLAIEEENPTEQQAENEQLEQNPDAEASGADKKTKKDEPKEKEKRGQQGNKAKTYASGDGVIAPVAEAETNKEKEDKKDKEDEQAKDYKKTFNALYDKARKGTLSGKDFDELAEIMKDPANYDKYGITTGVIFNKSKSALIAIAKIVGDTNTLSKEAREKLGLPVEKPNKENGLMSRVELMEWKGLKKLLANPDKKIAAEEQFKKVVALDRETLTKEQQEVWDKAQAHLSKYSVLRGALTAYNEVSQQRLQKNKWWFSRTSRAKSPKLPASASPLTPVKPTGMDFAGKVNEVIDDSTIPPRSTTIDEKGIQK